MVLDKKELIAVVPSARHLNGIIAHAPSAMILCFAKVSKMRGAKPYQKQRDPSDSILLPTLH
jgi:hypothetical protein